MIKKNIIIISIYYFYAILRIIKYLINIQYYFSVKLLESKLIKSEMIIKIIINLFITYFSLISILPFVIVIIFIMSDSYKDIMKKILKIILFIILNYLI